MRWLYQVLIVLSFAAGISSPGFSAPTAEGGHADVFGSISFEADNLAALPQWRAVVDTWHGHEKAAQSGAVVSGPLAETVWRAHVEGLDGLAPRQIVEDVNAFINKLLAGRDPDADSMVTDDDLWPTPRDVIAGKANGSLATAVLKFATLRLARIPNEDVRIVATRDILRDRRHFVVAVRLSDGTAILDTRGDVPRNESEISTYVPLYSFNETTRWIHFDPSDTDAQKAAVGPGAGGTAR